MKAMGGYVGDRDDPAKSFANSAPASRQDIWLRSEVLKLVQIAWRHGFYGLAACMAVAWDSMLSPIDTRPLTAGQASRDAFGLLFFLDRAKTGKAAAATLSQWSQAILLAYLEKLGLDLLDNTPLFWTRGGKPVSRKGETGRWGGDHGGGAHVKPRPYGKDRLEKDFAKVRELAFGADEMRQLGDMRRSGGRRFPDRSVQQDGQHGLGQQPSAQDLQSDERRQRAPLRRSQGDRRPNAGTKAGQKCHLDGPGDTFERAEGR
jgi:hypothetical protein